MKNDEIVNLLMKYKVHFKEKCPQSLFPNVSGNCIWYCDKCWNDGIAEYLEHESNADLEVVKIYYILKREKITSRFCPDCTNVDSICPEEFVNEEGVKNCSECWKSYIKKLLNSSSLR